MTNYITHYQACREARDIHTKQNFIVFRHNMNNNQLFLLILTPNITSQSLSLPQARIHQLLTQNKELLDHIQSLVAHLQDQERLHKVQVAQVAAVAAQQQQQQQHAAQQQQHQHNVNSTVPQVSATVVEV